VGLHQAQGASQSSKPISRVRIATGFVMTDQFVPAVVLSPATVALGEFEPPGPRDREIRWFSGLCCGRLCPLARCSKPPLVLVHPLPVWDQEAVLAADLLCVQSPLASDQAEGLARKPQSPDMPTVPGWMVVGGVSMQWIYQMRRAQVSRGDKVILDDVTLSFLPGAKIGVVGPNRAGKSTVLKIMAGR
jgi:ABC-type multidrug transport system fused ATPase/permease subunit